MSEKAPKLHEYLPALPAQWPARQQHAFHGVYGWFSFPTAKRAHEGFAFMEEHPELIPKVFRMRPMETMLDRFGLWRESGGMSWVIRFNLVQIMKGNHNG